MSNPARVVSRPADSCVDPEVAESDAELLAGIRRGDPDAFDAAYARLAPRLFRFLLRLCQRRHVAEDTLQDAWLKLATHAGALAPDTDLAAWLFTVARNAWLTRTRAETRVVDLAQAGDRAAPEPSPEAHAAASSSVRAVERALAALSASDREILLLVGIEELSAAATAKVLGVTDVVFRQRLHRARARLGLELGRAAERTSPDWSDE
jgi:RNA polymerase sigma-70 factor (ECF subfamily)